MPGGRDRARIEGKNIMSSTKSSTKANGTKSKTPRGASKASKATTSDTSNTSGAPNPATTFTTPAELNEAALRSIGLPPHEPGPIDECIDGAAVLVRALGALGTGSTARDLVALSALLSEFVSLAHESESAVEIHERVNMAAYVASVLAEAGNVLAHLESMARNELLAGVLAARGAA